MRIKTRRLQTGLLLAASFAIAGPCAAQDITVQPHLPEQDYKALREALSFNPAPITSSTQAKTVRSKSAPADKALQLNVERKDNTDGTGSVAVKTPLPITWDAKAGADMAIAGDGHTTYQPGLPAPGAVKDPRAGSAWASVAVPDVATVEARAARSDEQGTLGTTLRRSVPVGEKFAVTVENSYSVTETFAAAPGTPQIPLTPQTPAQSWGTEKQVKFNILPTGTTLSAGLASSTADPVTHNKFSAEQKIYGPLNVTTSVSDINQPVPNKSIGASFKYNW
jgi:hypothetical protein